MNGRHVPSLNSRQRELMKKYLDHYKALASGRKKPMSESGFRFLRVCAGKEEPSTDHEIAYCAFQKDVAEQGYRQRAIPRVISESPKPRQKVVLDGEFHVGSRVVHSPTPLRETPTFARKAAEPLGTREDFKKDSGRNWARARKPKD